MRVLHHNTLTKKTEVRLTEGARPLARKEFLRSLPRWQIERANRLHRKFLTVDAAIARGLTFKQAVRHFQWFWRKRNYQSDRDRKVQFGFGTLRRLWIQWRKGGRTPEALRLKYRGLPPSVPAELLCRFVEFCTRHQFPHMKDAWAEFMRRNGRFGKGRRAKQAPTASYGQLQYFFTGKKFAKLQSAQRSIERAENHLADLRLAFTAEIRDRLPDRPRRRRSGLELSQESATL